MATRNTPSALTQIIHSQPSWHLLSSDVEAYVTQTGGMVGPVTFDRRGKKIAPFSVAPWVDETLDEANPPIINTLRGDFFCMPFGGNDTPHRGEKHPVHGQTANEPWQFESLVRARGETTLHLSLRTDIRKGRVDKTITLIDGHPAIYSRHLISEMSGPMNLGHHAMLKFPEEAGSGLISTSKFVYGQVFPGEFEKASLGGYSSLKPGARFDRLSKVQSNDGTSADLTKYPARLGFEDLVMIVTDPKLSLGWAAVSFPRERYVWFALKDPKVLAETVFWMSNRGRHYVPWSSRHVGVMGIEDITGNFHYGIAESAKPNAVNKAGHPTVLAMSPRKPLTVNYIMACVPTPAGFDAVKSIVADRAGDEVTLTSASGKKVTASVHVRFLQGGIGR